MTGELDQQALEEWAEWVPELLEGIEAGYLDAHLRAIARAVFTRRDAIKGTSTVVPDGQPPATLVATGTVVAVEAAYLPPRSIKPNRQGPSLFEYKGVTFRRGDVIGQVVRIPDGTFGQNSKYSGMLVKIAGVGPSRVKATWVTEYGLVGRMKDAARSGDPVFLPRTVLDEVLDY